MKVSKFNEDQLVAIRRAISAKHYELHCEIEKMEKISEGLLVRLIDEYPKRKKEMKKEMAILEQVGSIITDYFKM